MAESYTELGNIFSTALTEAVSKTTGILFKEISGERDTDFYSMVSFMSLCGKKKKTLYISAEENVMRIICSLMTGIKESELLEEDILDALSELLNITSGSAKMILSETENAFMLTSPAVIKGKNMHVFTKKNKHFISRTLSDGKIEIKLKII